MQVSVEHTSSIEKRLKIQIPAEEVQQQVDVRLRELGKQVKLKGFRPGRIPFSVLRQRYGSQATQEVILHTTKNSLQQAIEQEALHIAAMPKLEQAPTLDNDTGLEINAILEVYPEIETIDVADITIERPDVSVTDDDVEAMLTTLKKQRIEWKDVERKPQQGDQVLIEYSAETEAGTVPEEGKHRLAVIIGESGFEALEKALAGMSAGDETGLDMEFPGDFNELALAGRSAKVALTVSNVKQGVEPEVDEEFVISFGVPSGDIDEFKTEIRANLKRELKQAVTTQLKTQLLERLLERFDGMEVPESLVANEAHHQLQQMLRGQDIEISQKMLEPLMDPARKRVRSGLLLSEIAKQNDITVDGARVREAIDEIAQTYEQPVEVVQTYYKDEGLLRAVENSVLEGQVVDWVVDNATVTDKAMGFQDAINAATQAAGKA